MLAIVGAGLLVPGSSVDPLPARAAFTGRNGKIAFAVNQGAVGDSEIVAINGNGSGAVNLTDNPVEDTAPAWSPTGALLAFVRDVGGGSEIFVMNADGSGQTNLTNSSAGVINSQPAWSPDGTRIVFASNRTSGNTDIWVMDANGANPTRLTTDAGSDDQPAWSPDGSKILFSRESANIFVMNADGSSQTDLTKGAGTLNVEPNWSPDGSRIAFASNRTSGNTDVWIMDASGANPVRLTTSSGVDIQPAWSPDGSQIAFASDRDGADFDIFVMNADGSNPTNLTSLTAGFQDTEPAWQPIAPALAISILESPDPLTVGQIVSYAISVINTGSATAENVVVTNTLPVGVTFISAVPSQGTCGTPVNGVFSCDLVNLTAGVGATILVSAVVDSAGTLVDTATAVGRLSEANLVDNSASASTTANAGATLTPTATSTSTLVPTATLTPIPSQTATPPPTATPIPTHCSPRPPVTVQTAPTSNDRLDVAVTANTPFATTDNRLQSIRIVGTENAVVESAGVQHGAPFTFTLADQPLSFSFGVRRLSSGPFLVRLVAVDVCGEWPTFVGAGSGF